MALSSPRRSSVLDLSWDQLPDLPAPFPKYPCAVFLDGVIYVGGATTKSHTHTIFTYTFGSGQEAWGKLPRCPRQDFGMGVADHTLIIVGGVEGSNKKSGKVTAWDAAGQQWREGYYPTLTHARTNPCVVTHENWLLVIGGAGGVVEKLDVDSHKSWTACPSVPERCSELSCVAIDHTLYVASTLVNSVTSSVTSESSGGRGLYSVLLPLLVRIKPKDTTVWKKMAAIPTPFSSLCALSQKFLLAVGGEMDVSSSLSLLSPVLSLGLRKGASNKWERVGTLPCERICCTCLCVGAGGRGGRVVVLGGTQTQAQEGLRRVDLGTLKGQR